MKLINFIVWLSAGAVIGWFAQRMIHGNTSGPTNQCLTRIPALRRAKPCWSKYCKAQFLRITY